MKRVKHSAQKSSSEDESNDLPEKPSKSFKRSNPFFQTENDRDDDSSDKSDIDSLEDSDSEFDSDTDDESNDSDNDQEQDDAPSNENEREEEEEEDSLIQALKKSKEKKPRSSPPDIKFKSGNLMDISFHPSENLIVSSLMEGEISMFEFGIESNKLRKKLHIHKSSVRTVEFDLSGKFLCSGSKDKSFKLTDVETSQVVYKCAKAHKSALYKVKPLTENLIATGDEDGFIKLWDNRLKTGDDGSANWSSVMEAQKFDEFVSDIFFDPNVDDKIMVASSGEGTICSFNLRGKRPDLQSEVYEGEMNAMSVVHKNSKLVTACGDGRLYMFDWKLFGYHSAEFPGHPDAINDLVSATENVIITACEDGAIRAVHLYPHRFIGTVGHHEDSFPVERLDISSTGELVASISHDQKIKFWNIKYLEDMDYDKRPKPYHQKKMKVRRKENKMKLAQEIEHQLPSSNRGNRKDFFKGLEEET